MPKKKSVFEKKLQGLKKSDVYSFHVPNFGIVAIWSRWRCIRAQRIKFRAHVV